MCVEESVFTKIPLRASLGIRSLISVLSKALGLALMEAPQHGCAAISHMVLVGAALGGCGRHITSGSSGGHSAWVWQTHSLALVGIFSLNGAAKSDCEPKQHLN